MRTRPGLIFNNLFASFASCSPARANSLVFGERTFVWHKVKFLSDIEFCLNLRSPFASSSHQSLSGFSNRKLFVQQKVYSMGTFLQTGIINEFSFSTSATKLKGISLHEFKTNVARTVVDSLDSFSCEDEGGGFYRWNWKREARRMHLVPLLARYYVDFYGKDSEDFATYCKPVINFLSDDPSDDDLISWAEEEGFETFYPADDWFRMAAVNGQDVKVNVSLVSLSSEGKVLVEEMQQHLSFFEKALRFVYGDNPFGKCLKVDVG
jgi:hypothetical protein